MDNRQATLVRSRSTLFLIELLIMITVFAVCAAVCVSIFISAYLMANDQRDISHALKVSQNGAELYKKMGDAQKTADILRGYVNGTPYVFFENDWKIGEEKNAAYVLRLIETTPMYCDISVEKVSGDVIIAFTVASRRGAL